MKRFTISIIILSIIIITAFYLPFYLKRKTNQFIETINNITYDIKINNTIDAEEKTKKFIKNWENEKEIINTFVNHQELDTVTYSAARLISLLKYNDKSEFCSELNYIKSIIQSVYDDEIPNLHNIF